MECFYCPELTSNSAVISLNEDESKHAKALRIKHKEKVFLTNGLGLIAVASAMQKNKFDFIFQIESIDMAKGELHFSVGIALGVLDKRERMEFALEKSVELGAKDFYPLISQYSSKSRVNLSRLQLKAISAMKQSIRSNLIKIHEPVTIPVLCGISKNYSKLVLGDYDGIKPVNSNSYKSVLIIIGPEGGFAPKETEILKKLDNLEMWNLGNRRLRAETAAICAMSILTAMQ